jgi:hypothetical protein
LTLLTLDPLVFVRQRLLPQRFGIGRFRSSQRARWWSVPTGQAIKEGTHALHAGLAGMPCLPRLPALRPLPMPPRA